MSKQTSATLRSGRQSTALPTNPHIATIGVDPHRLARRGCPTLIVSDSASQFRLTPQVLHSANISAEDDELKIYATSEGIMWNNHRSRRNVKFKTITHVGDENWKPLRPVDFIFQLINTNERLRDYRRLRQQLFKIVRSTQSAPTMERTMITRILLEKIRR